MIKTRMPVDTYISVVKSDRHMREEFFKRAPLNQRQEIK